MAMCDLGQAEGWVCGNRQFREKKEIEKDKPWYFPE